ncbi:MAG: energy-coupling factor ABC transporter ATP-binding protein [Oculatellaceae cyanobacterium Prado106]|jgi:cobalt/nickel transport system ATP-binding protein|nr:energy-coupling factor ABC transporter ATP-binding protein [Oculatellaceae cyanobacterium Prado106]
MHHNPIHIENLSYAYADGTQALSRLNLSIQANERVAIVGANGSGKSTLLQHLNGILLPQTGEIIVGEMPVEPRYLTAIRNFVGLVFQNPDDQIFMPTVWEDVTFGPMNQGLRGHDLMHRSHHAMQAVGLTPEVYADRLASNLSGGEKKRVAIAGVLAMQPQVLVLDEPTAQLDPRCRRQLIRLLENLPLTQIIATHDLDLAVDICSRTVVLSQGKIVYDGSTATLMSDSAFLEQHALEMPLCFSRPYCRLEDHPLEHPHPASLPSFSA